MSDELAFVRSSSPKEKPRTTDLRMKIGRLLRSGLNLFSLLLFSWILRNVRGQFLQQRSWLSGLEIKCSTSEAFYSSFHEPSFLPSLGFVPRSPPTHSNSSKFHCSPSAEFKGHCDRVNYGTLMHYAQEWEDQKAFKISFMACHLYPALMSKWLESYQRQLISELFDLTGLFLYDKSKWINWNNGCTCPVPIVIFAFPHQGKEKWSGKAAQQ